MSIRRKSPNNLSTLNGPSSATKRSPVSKRAAAVTSNKVRAPKKSSKEGKSPTLKLAAPASKLVGDLTLEQLLDLPPHLAHEEMSQQDREKVAVERVEEAKEALGRLEHEVISSLFPAKGLPQSEQEIATRLGMTLKEVREIADNALRGLRGTKSSKPRLSTVWN